MQNQPLTLSTREDAIASAWYQAMAVTGDLPQPAEYIRQELLQLTRQITALFSDAAFQAPYPAAYRAAEARAMGQKLALLGFKHVDVLTSLQSNLVQTLLQDADQDQVVSISTALGRIFIDLTAGFLDQRRQEMELDREEALRAYETEWKRFIADRREMEQKSQAILRALPDTVSIVTLDGIVLYYHGGPDKNFPKEEELPFKNIRSYLPGKVADELLTIYFGVIETGRPRTHEYTVNFPSGARRDYQDNITPYLGNSVLVISRDVTHHNQVEEELRVSEARYRSVVETQNEMIGRFLPNGTITFVNQAIQRVLGIPLTDMLGHKTWEFSPDLAQGLANGTAPDLNLTPQNPATTQEWKVVLEDGNTFQLETSTQAIFNLEGEITEYQTTARDVTALRQVEAALRASEARYRSVVEGQTELIVRYLMDGTITFANDALCEFFSIPRQEILGTPALAMVYEDDRTEFAGILASLKHLTAENPLVRGQARVAIGNHELRWIEWTTRVIFDANGLPTECQSVGRDITDLKEAQVVLEQHNELLRQLGEQLISVQENERQRIARDLHDSVLNELGAMVIAPQELLTPQTVRENYERLIDQLRQTINGLRSPMLSYGLYPALEDLMDYYMDNPQAGGIVNLEIPPSQARFETNVELHLFRIIQQACDNALQHAQANSIRVYGSINEDHVALFVEDDGIGFPLGQETDMAYVLAKKHFGLASMVERGKLIGADVRISSNPGDGTKVSVFWEPVYYWT